MYMKKFLLSLGIVFASALYIVFGAQKSTTVTSVMDAGGGVSSSLPVGSSGGGSSSSVTSSVARPAGNPKPVTQPTPTTTPASKPVSKGQYADGTYTGSAEDAYYGLVQVEAIIQGGKLTDVQFLQYPNDRRTSQMINAQATMALKQEAIQAQSANVDVVSGATDTSAAFQQSLASALAQAKS